MRCCPKLRLFHLILFALALLVGAGNVTGTLDGHPVGMQFNGPNGDGRWRADLDLSPGSHTFLLTAYLPNANLITNAPVSTNAASYFNVAANLSDTVSDQFDGNGNVTQRSWVSPNGLTNRTQTFTWDAFDRPIKISERDNNLNGFDYVSIYDGLGRRVRTIDTMVLTNTPIVTPASVISTVDSQYDPQAEFLEIGVSVNSVYTAKSYGPDANGVYGGLNGVGGLESVTPNNDTATIGIVQDFFGNVIGTVNNTTLNWSAARFSSYGPVPGYQLPALSLFRLEPNGAWTIIRRY